MLTLADAWLHDLSPFLWRISGDFGIRWYGLSYLLGFAIAWLALRWLINRDAIRLSKERASDAIVFAAIGAIVGGRLGYVLFYQPSLLWSLSSDLPFWGVLRLNEGGMASHGGMIGIAVAAWLVSRGPKADDGSHPEAVPFLHVFDVYALIGPFGLLLGRLANFINGELLGKIVASPGEQAPSWAVRFPQELAGDHAPPLTAEQSAQLGRLLDDYRLDAFENESVIFDRVLRGLQSGTPEIAQRLEPLVSARHPSQLYQAVAEGVLLSAAVWIVARRPRIPGQILSVWLVVYGILRIATEFYRLPDAHLAVQRFAGLSRGQWLSAVMIAIGVGLFFWVSRRGQDKLGGWAKPSISAA